MEIIQELKNQIQELNKQIEKAKPNSKEKVNLISKRYRINKKIKDIIEGNNRRAILSNPISRELYFNSSVKDTKVEKSKQIIKLKCSRCGNLIESGNEYYIDIFNLNKGYVCDKCNKKYYYGKGQRILINYNRGKK